MFFCFKPYDLDRKRERQSHMGGGSFSTFGISFDICLDFMLRNLDSYDRCKELPEPALLLGSLGGHCASLGLSKTSRTAQESHQGRQDGPTCLRDGQRWLQEGPRQPHDGRRCPLNSSKRPPGRLKRAPRGASRGPEEAKTNGFVGASLIFGFSRFRASVSSRRPRRPQDCPKRA